MRHALAAALLCAGLLVLLAGPSCPGSFDDEDEGFVYASANDGFIPSPLLAGPSLYPYYGGGVTPVGYAPLVGTYAPYNAWPWGFGDWGWGFGDFRAGYTGIFKPVNR